MKSRLFSLRGLRAFRSATAAVLFAAWSGQAPAQATTSLTLANPNWNITLSDFGYSDFLLDNTPGFEGREYLSGEWGAAVGYTVGGTPVPPKWLDPQWWFPDWLTNSDFEVVTPITQTGLNADNLPIAVSVIKNQHLEITLRYEMIDTVTGTPMGVTPASSAGPGSSLPSNRYVLKQTCTIKNISTGNVSDLQFFQLLHGLSSQRGVFDNRAHAGPSNNFQHDITLAGIDPWSAGTNTSSAGLEDYIGFHSNVAPDAFEVGYYGIEGNGVDSHGIGKPSDGVHLSIENNWQDEPYFSRQGTDSFQPPQHWVAGAQRWTLAPLAPNQTVSHEVLLTIVTGTRVTTGTGSSGGCNGGSSVPGGLDYLFDDVSAEGSCFTDFSRADDQELEIRIAEGEFDAFDFPTPGRPAQVWDVTFNGTFNGSVDLAFGYDDTLLPSGFDEEGLVVYHFDGSTWQPLAGVTVDPVANTISAPATQLGVFVLGTGGSLTTYPVTATANPTQGGTVTGDGTFATGSSITLVATPLAGYAFINWTENGTPVSSSPNLTLAVTAARNWVANFVAVGNDHAIATSSQPPNGGTTTGGGAYPSNTSVTVHAVAAPGYKFSKWLENGVSVSTAKDYTFIVTALTADRVLVAKFKPVYTVVASAEPEAGGETEADPVYEPGELAKLKATPNKGYSFVNWTQNGVVVSTQPNFQFNVTGNRTLVANFALGNRIDVSADPANAGSASGGGVFTTGNPITLVATTKPGYLFLHWSEGNSPVSTEPSYTFDSSASRTLVANFIALPSVATAADGAGGLTISWPDGAAGWLLEESSDLRSGNWAECTRPFVVVGAHRQIQIDNPTGAAFFRLAHP